jgi:hypothetical protein
MAWFRRSRPERPERDARDARAERPDRSAPEQPTRAASEGRATRRTPLLQVQGLDVYYGRAHALQGVSLELDHGVLGMVGRNGMGKTTLCNAITGLVPASGSVKLAGEEILGQYGHEYWLTRGGRRVPAVKNTEAVKSAAEPWKSLLVSGQLRVADRYEQEAAALAWLFEQSREALAQGQGAGVTSTTRQERTRSAADKGGGRASGSGGRNPTSSNGSPSASRGFGSAPPGKRATRKKQ